MDIDRNYTYWHRFLAWLLRTPLAALPTHELQVMRLLLDPECRNILCNDPSHGFVRLTPESLRLYLRRNRFPDDTTYKIMTPTGSVLYHANDLPLIDDQIDARLPPTIAKACEYIFWTRANAQHKEVLRLLMEGFSRASK